MDWFKLKEPSGYNVRREKKYIETRARTERLKKSPLHYMRRRLNEEDNKEEATVEEI